MYFKQFYLGCLAHASYLVGSEGEAAVVDPQRDVDLYIMEAASAGLEIKYVIETHLHADFVSGHRELAARTGAEIIFGSEAGATFPHRAVADGDEISVGRVILRFLETPGHTPESISVLIINTEVSDEAQKVLTGDTLFIGDVGRPDLAGARGYTSQQMAAMLYDSLHEKLLKLDDRVEVYPAHGAGSMCGRNISKETSSTIGQQRRFNYALKSMSKEEFVEMMTKDLPPAPPYFSHDAEENRAGAPAIKEIARPAALSPEEVNKRLQQGFLILDVRVASEFGAGHAPTALNIGLNGQFASWAGTLIAMNTPLVIVADEEVQVDEAVVRLARVGHESVRGFLKGGMEAWKQAGLQTATVEQISVERLRELLDEENGLQLLDVRRPAEYADGHVPSALSLPLNSQLGEQAARFDANSRTAVICAGGYRSSAATSILERSGFNHLLNVTGGTTAWINAGYPVEKQ
ncbi:MAG TPA: rhodanese-like domain-containing protein [Pyrinomonadaceae bacterium]|nr:rhodanese-like domain-containing protein [Pyrinomonadaceae bacterium]